MTSRFAYKRAGSWLKVYLDGGLVGSIRPVRPNGAGYAYFPRDSQLMGEVFDSIGAVKVSIEQE